MVEDNVLCYDIETRVFGKPDSNRDRLRIFGCYSYKTKKTYLLTDKEQIQKIINVHKFLVGFNNEAYDNPVLEREGISLKYKTIIDLRKIFKMRAGAMQIDKGMLGDLIMSYSLDFITKLLGLVDEDSSKIKIDYKIFEKETWTKEELDKISKYTIRDVEVTRKLYEWIETYFESFKDFLYEQDVERKIYLTSTIAKFAYKAICKAMNWSEEYGEITGNEGSISGGYVAYPAGPKFEGDIFCLDFNSLYPFIMIQCNLYGRKHDGEINERPVWTGGGKWKVEGVYYADKLSGVGELLFKWYQDRLKYKKENDSRQFTLKIIINTIYGILNNPHYVRVFDLVAGGDCTRIGRQWTKYTRKVFNDNGYKVIYSDTDSIYIIDHLKNKEKMLKLKEQIINDIKQTVPFPKDLFDMGIDDEIKYMFFFKGGHKEDKQTDVEMDALDFVNKPLGYMKKNYIYVTNKDKVKVKNLGIRKKSNSQLSKEIFWKHLVPEIKKGTIKFKKTFIRNLIMELLEKDISLACMRKEVGNYSQYEKKSPNGLQAQIALKYGSGTHFLIPNNSKIGVGKGKSFCTIEEFKANNLRLDNIDLSNVWKELEYFIAQSQTKGIFDFEESKK